MIKKTTSTWSQMLAQARDLQRQGAAMIYDRVKLYRDIYHDADFRADCDKTKTDAIERLDAECADINPSCFLTLSQVWKKFPDRETWLRTKLQSLVAGACDDEDKQTRDHSTPRVSWKAKYEEAQKMIESLQRRISAQEGQIDELRRLLELQLV